jgi:hypothetical protein
MGGWALPYFGLALLFLASCVQLPRPRALDAADAASRSRPIVDAAERVPQAFARAEKLRQQAQDAYDGEHLSRAEALAEQALAAYQRATAQARLLQAMERRVLAQKELDETRERLASLGEQQSALVAEVNGLELRLKVIRDALPIEPLESADPKRQAARRTAALALLETSRLLCASAELLSPENPATKKLTSELDALAEKLASPGTPAAIDQALALRTACLQALTAVRRPTYQNAPAEDSADVLLSQVGPALPESAPYRDDRGVVIPFRDFFTGSALSAAGTGRLGQLVAIASAHPAFPLLVVLHSARANPAQNAERGAALKAALQKAGLGGASVHIADARLPVGVEGIKGAKSQDERVEFVFVAR